jgi:transcriptional regulator with XRE-family HTH domain
MATTRQPESRHPGGRPREKPSTRIGALIERRAQAVGLHLDEVASRAEISFQAINDIRRGKTKNPSSLTLANIARVLRVPVDDLTKAL